MICVYFCILLDVNKIPLTLLFVIFSISNPSTWNEETVEQLGILASYFKSDLCNTLKFVCKALQF